jgi:hypothetical protein
MVVFVPQGWLTAENFWRIYYNVYSPYKNFMTDVFLKRIIARVFCMAQILTATASLRCEVVGAKRSHQWDTLVSTSLK